MIERTSIFIAVLALLILGLLMVFNAGAEDFAKEPRHGSDVRSDRIAQPPRNTQPYAVPGGTACASATYQIELAGVYVVRLNTITGEVRFKSLVEDGDLVGNGRPLWLPDAN